jgi:hypothetical protein
MKKQKKETTKEKRERKKTFLFALFTILDQGKKGET